MTIEPNEIDAAIRRDFIRYGMSLNAPMDLFSEREQTIIRAAFREGFRSGAAFGLDKATSVVRGSALASDQNELTRRLASSTVPEQLAANLETMDVRA